MGFALFIASVALILSGFLCVMIPPVKVKPAPRPQPRPVIDPPPMEFDPLAFWLFPDWDGPIDEPFWMREPKAPRSSRHMVGGGNIINFGGFANVNRYREFVTDGTGNTVTVNHWA